MDHDGSRRSHLLGARNQVFVLGVGLYADRGDRDCHIENSSYPRVEGRVVVLRGDARRCRGSAPQEGRDPLQPLGRLAGDLAARAQHLAYRGDSCAT